MIRALLVITLSIVMPLLALSQQRKDSIPPAKLVINDTTGKVIEKTAVKTVAADTTNKKPKHDPRKAALRSAIIPGWGQIYNKKYWKVPIVYAAIGIPTYLVIDNNRWYNRTRFALRLIASSTSGSQSWLDSLNNVHPQLKHFVDEKNSSSLINYRNEFRRNMDYSILFGLLFWGLNIVDATVDAHLKDFDVSDDLTLRIQPALLPGNAAGLSFVFTFGNTRPKTITSLR
jgi:hypothetical protein